MSKHTLGTFPDTPCHIGYAKKAENDPRRHRSRCTHYRKDGSCSVRSYCYGSSQCPSYEDAILKKQKEEYRANRKTWSELAPAQPDQNTVQLDDYVLLYSHSDGTHYELDFNRPLNSLPELHKAVLGLKIGTSFDFRGEKYKVTGKFKTREDLQNAQNRITTSTSIKCVHLSNKKNCKLEKPPTHCSPERRTTCQFYKPQNGGLQDASKKK